MLIWKKCFSNKKLRKKGNKKHERNFIRGRSRSGRSGINDFEGGSYDPRERGDCRPGAEAKETVAYQIAVQAVPELADKELLSIYMPMTHDAKELEENHRKGAKALEEVLDQGNDIVFLTLGDPTIYSTFSYLQKRVEDDGYETALVSGITSFCAAAARTNQPLVEWNQTLHIVPAVHRLGDTPDAEGNYVFMKSGKKMKQVKEILRETGKQVSMVENCGMETEHVYRSVDEIPDDAGYYSLIIAKEMESGK